MSSSSTSSSQIDRDLVDHCGTFLRRYYNEEIGQLANHYPKDQSSLYVDWFDLFQYDPDPADDAIDNHDGVKEHLEVALAEYDVPIDVSLAGATVRLCNFDQTRRPGEERSRHAGTAYTYRGQIAKVSEIKPKVEDAGFECQRCGVITRIPQFGEHFQEPNECEGCKRQGPFRLDPGESEFIDHQFVRLQEPPEEAKGTEPTTMDCHLTGDVVGQATAGDRVQVDGVLRMQPPDGDDQRMDEYFEASALRVEDTQFDDIDVDEHRDRIEEIASGDAGDPYAKIVDSIAPGHYGDEDIKLALALQMFGGVNVRSASGRLERGNSHMLLMGAPGVGKSTLLDYVNEMSPRSTMSSGKGMTAAGMTAAAVRDEFGNTEWTLEAGALVMADGGIACIDEIDKANEDALDSLHRALEQQSVEVSKAGINATLPTETSLLASGNPEKGRFDPNRPFAEQITLDTALISRFDLIFLMDDRPDEEEDAAVASHIMDRREFAKGGDTGDDSDVEPAIEPEVMRAYIALARQEVQPTLSRDVYEQALEYYKSFRGANGHDANSPVPVTPRNFEAGLRLAEASARIRLSDTIEEQDWKRGAQLIESSLRDVGIDPDTDQFDVDIVETGQSMVQKDRRELIIKTVRELQDEDDSGVVGLDTIVAETVNNDDVPVTNRSQVEHDVRELKKQGELYEPAHGGEEEYRVP